jgi:hypothetical protein
MKVKLNVTDKITSVELVDQLVIARLEDMLAFLTKHGIDEKERVAICVLLAYWEFPGE